MKEFWEKVTILIFKIFCSLTVAGQNTFVIVDKQEDTITFFNTNVDENGLVTRGYVVVGEY